MMKFESNSVSVASSSYSKSKSRSPSQSPERSSSPRSAFGRLRRKLSGRKPEKRSNVESDHKCGGELRKVFGYFDEDGDGKISPAELQSCVMTVGGELTAEEAEAAVRAADLDGDGLLGYEEFEKLMEGSGEEEEKKKELKEAFGMYEMEGSGCITATSLRRMLSRLGESRSVEDCKSMIGRFDLNGDGVLSFDEFRVMMR